MTRPAAPPTYTISRDAAWLAGETLRVVDGRAEWRSPSGTPDGPLQRRWTRAPLSTLARRCPDDPVWAWLAEHGVERPTTSGPSGRRRAPNRPSICYRPSPAARAALERVAEREEVSLSVALDALVLGADELRATERRKPCLQRRKP